MTNDLYNKPDKATLKQQLRARIALTTDELVRLKKETCQVETELVQLMNQLDNLNNTGGTEICG